MQIGGKMDCYIWGAAANGKKALIYVKNKFKVKGFIDKKAEKEAFKFNGYDVITPNEAFKILKEDKNLFLIITIRFPAEILQKLEDNKIKNKVYIFDPKNETDSVNSEHLLYEVNDGEICVPECMDKMYVEWKEYSKKYTDLNTLEINRLYESFSMLKKHHNGENLFEIGCGSGQFANILFDNGYTNYTGLDFSKNAIELAIKANPKYKENFIVADVFDYLKNNKQDKTINTTFIIFEVLEHIKKDVELISLLRDVGGINILFSVPNFQSFNHLRTFQNIDEIMKRYDMLNILDYSCLQASSVYEWKKFHIVYAKLN